MTELHAHKVYDILVEIGGANEEDRYGFVHHHSKENPCSEWRFCGHLGFGGKYRRLTNKVDCYPEHLNARRQKIIDEINQKLEVVAERSK